MYTSEGAFEEILFMLEKMRWLAQQAASDTLTRQERELIQREIDNLKEGIDRVAEEMQFNNQADNQMDNGAVGDAGNANLGD